MLSYSEITAGKMIVLDGEPFEVIGNQISKKSRQKASNQVKLKNLKTGKVTERGFHQSDEVIEAEIEKRPSVYLFNNRGECTFHAEGDPKSRFTIAEDMIGSALQLLKERSVVDVVYFDDEIIGVSLPIKVDLKVTEAAPAVRGNTAQNANKQVVVETGATISVPMFINQDDLIRINTDTGEYVERAEKG